MEVLAGEDDTETDDERHESVPLFEFEAVDGDRATVGGGDRHGAETGDEEDGRECGVPETSAYRVVVWPIRGDAVRAGRHCSGVVSGVIYSHRFGG